jgi:hypothetical protein
MAFRPHSAPCPQTEFVAHDEDDRVACGRQADAELARLTLRTQLHVIGQSVLSPHRRTSDGARI